MGGDRGQSSDARFGSAWTGDEAELRTIAVSSDFSEATSGSVLPPLRGRYVVVGEVGRGGMGRVLRAYDPKLQREVALKMLHRQALGEQGARRLAAEARAMAKLSHPNVVAIYDVQQTAPDRVVLVMELVVGTTLRRWVRERPRPWRAVLDRFRRAGRGLAAAHAVGLLHRDFKPSNVLVSDEGLTKVSDFGLATGQAGSGSGRLDCSEQESRDPASDVSATFTNPRLEVGALEGDEEIGGPSVTEAGVVLGTPRYMAPEQHAGEPLTAAADQYAFCVALWESLCGEPPFSIAPDVDPDEMSARLVEAKRRGPPAWPNKSVPRGIAHAVQRGLAPEPTRRWSDMDTLLDALAFDPGRRRGRWFLGLAGIAVMGAGSVAWHGWSAAQAERCTGATMQLEGVWDEARRARLAETFTALDASFAVDGWTTTATGLDQYARHWKSVHEDACRATNVRKEQSVEVMDLRMACLQQSKTELAAVVELLSSADVETAVEAHKVVSGLPPIDRCSAVDALRAAGERPAPGEAQAVARIGELMARARASTRAARFVEARQALRDADALLEGLRYEPVRVEVALAKGQFYEKLGEYGRAEEPLREALYLASRSRRRREIGEAATRLLWLFGYRYKRFDEGLHYRGLAEALADDARTRWAVRNKMAVIRYAQGRYEESEAEHRRALDIVQSERESDSLAHALTRNNLANTLSAQGKYEQAEAQLRTAVALRQAALGARHPEVAQSRSNLGTALNAQGKHEEAEAELRASLSIREEVFGSEHPEVAETLNNLGIVLLEVGRAEEALQVFQRTLQIRQATLRAGHPDVGQTLSNVAAVLIGLGRYDEAEPILRRGIAMWEVALGSEHPDVVAGRVNLAIVLYQREEYEQGYQEHRRALRAWESTIGATHPQVVGSRAVLARVLISQAQWSQARSELEKVLEALEETREPSDPELMGVRMELASVDLALAAAG